MHRVLRDWPLRDIRLLGKILRLNDDPLEATQDFIHVLQKRHPLGTAEIDHTTGWTAELPEEERLVCLGTDVYFVPINMILPQHVPYGARLLIGRVVAHLSLSRDLLRLGKEDPQTQWISFDQEHVATVLEAHPAWYQGWQDAWAAYEQAMLEELAEQEQARLDYPIDDQAVRALLQHDVRHLSLQQNSPAINVLTRLWGQSRRWLGPKNIRQQ
jgi:hypothetical protein